MIKMKFKRVLAIILIGLMVFSLAACGGKTAIVSINDDGLKTELETKLPKTVDKILEEAGIALGTSDVVTPAAGEKLSEGGEIKIDRMHKVTLTASGNTQTLEIVGGTVADLLEAGGVKLEGTQATNFDLSEPLKEGMAVEVFDQMSVTFVFDGESKTVVVNSAVVGEAIRDAGITLGADDEVEPSVDSRVTDGMEIVIDRVKYETVTETEAIAYEVSYEYDGTMAQGTEYTTVYGEEGEKEVTYKVKFVNGEESDKEIVEEKVTKEPTTAVVVVGTMSGPIEISRTNYPDCDDSGHGYYEVVYQYPDGSIVTVYEEY